MVQELDFILRKGTGMKAETYNLDFTVTLTPEDAKFTDTVVAAGIPLIVASMYGKALRKLVEDEREACAKLCDKGSEQMLHKYQREGASRCAEAIRVRGQS